MVAVVAVMVAVAVALKMTIAGDSHVVAHGLIPSSVATEASLRWGIQCVCV